MNKYRYALSDGMNTFGCNSIATIPHLLVEVVHYQMNNTQWNGIIYPYDMTISTNRWSSVLKYIMRDIYIPSRDSSIENYKEVVDFVYTTWCRESLRMTPELRKYMESYLRKYWTINDELRKYRESVEYSRQIECVPGYEGYIQPEYILKKMIGRLTWIKKYREANPLICPNEKYDEYAECSVEENAALVSLVASTNIKNLEYVGIHTFVIKFDKVKLQVVFDRSTYATDGETDYVYYGTAVKMLD